VAEEFGKGVVEVEVVTLKEPAGAERYRELRRVAGEHLPVPSVLVEGRLVAPSIPEQDDLRLAFGEALGLSQGAGSISGVGLRAAEGEPGRE
jgi:hypothetical protein